MTYRVWYFDRLFGWSKHRYVLPTRQQALFTQAEYRKYGYCTAVERIP